MDAFETLAVAAFFSCWGEHLIHVFTDWLMEGGIPSCWKYGRRQGYRRLTLMVNLFVVVIFFGVDEWVVFRAGKLFLNLSAEK